ncbi:16S rRNA (uracil(1498)-N(3))-methyltransferase [Sciscionella marina]|uniref:16S rRNA (uracil(1498)-N(3))-methyltransferase n=1 Tax=Sciscionella marina TaxID=508770 RepID=UPI0003694018|nr:16S rRNA (uracil(1498)-N(3))-methyltransferase [Sciscionella marina]
MSTAPVFLTERLPDGEFAVLDGPEGHHAATVRRLRTGESLVLTDGAGTSASCVIENVERDRLELRITERVRSAPAWPRVTVVQALVKGDRGELAVELATEAGADAIVPWRANRCVARWDEGPRGAKALARWRSTVTSAAKQARRSWVPEVAEPVSTLGLANLAAEADLAVVLHESASRPLTELDLADVGEVLLIIGPEGGIDDGERDRLGAAGAAETRLGPQVLRASTAAAVALGALGALTPRWSGSAGVGS